jgi:multicomponent Na+:H+ antiporter subunit G
MMEWLSGGLFVGGATLALLASIGVLRMPDLFQDPEFAVLIRAASIAAFTLLTTAVGAHVIARAAALTGAPLWKGSIVDERPERDPGDHYH